MRALIHFENYIFYAEEPIASLEVHAGNLYRDNLCIGSASELGKSLELPKSSDFFPAWIGFIGYEYATYFGLDTHTPNSNFPEAAFFLFDHPASCAAFSKRSHFNRKISSLWSSQEFQAAVRILQEEIRDGNVYQVNLCRSFEILGLKPDPLELYLILRKLHPSPFMAFIETPDWAIVSGSPERLFKLHNGHITTKPIAGTRPRHAQAEQELISSSKECAEHAMLVDLMRNDLNKICQIGSVQVSKAFSIEHYPHVIHWVSEVSGQTEVDLDSVLKAIFPGGTITGTPKESAMRFIKQYEPEPRGPYTGSLGYVSSGYGIDFNILIRSIYLGRFKNYFSAGAGIVIDSNPQSEWEETEHKISQFRNLFRS